MLGRLWPIDRDEADCKCSAEVDGNVLRVSADGCPGHGHLSREPACREHVARHLGAHDLDVVITSTQGTSRRYEGRATALLTGAGRAAPRFHGVDADLARRSLRYPSHTAEEVRDRAGEVAQIGAETGFTAVIDGLEEPTAVLTPLLGPSIAGSRVAPNPPESARLAERRSLDTGALAHRYTRPQNPLDALHLTPPGTALSTHDRAMVAGAVAHLANGTADAEELGPYPALRQVDGSSDADLDTLARVLRKHTQGLGVLEDLFAIDGLTDIFAAAPVAANDLRVRIAGETLTTNVRITARGAEALASRLRQSSGRAFSRATPTLDAGFTLDGTGERVRVAAVTDPVCEGPGFAVRSHASDPWTLPRLLANGTVTKEIAGLLSVAVDRGASILVAGSRGAGKTTLLGALTWELPHTTRLVTLEDTPELPVETLQQTGRDVQPLYTDSGKGIDAAEGLRTALRLGEGAIAVGEVRGDEARVLYEAMRIGANASAVLGTIHGAGIREVRRRVIEDLGVPQTAFAATDVVVTCERVATGDEQSHRLSSLSEVLGAGADANASLFQAELTDAGSTGRIQRGNSALVASLCNPSETYSDLLDVLETRGDWLESLASDKITGPAAVNRAHAERRAES